MTYLEDNVSSQILVWITEKRIRKEIGEVFGGKFKGREYEVNTKMDKIRAEEFAKYKMKYLKDYRQPTDGWMTPDPADLLRKSE